MLSLHMHRAWLVSLAHISPYWSSRLRALLRRGSLSLSKLVIMCPPRSNPADFKPEINIDLTVERFPLLQNLHLTYAQAPNDVTLYSNLCKLTLEGCVYAGTFQNFVTSIRSATRVTHIGLNNFLSQFPLNQISLSISPANPNPLLRLTSLVVRDDPVAHISSFLSHLNFTTERLALQGQYPRDAENDTPETLLYLLPATGLDDSCLSPLERAEIAVLEAYEYLRLTAKERTGPYDLVELELYSLQWQPSLSSGLLALSRVLRPAGNRLIQLSVHGIQDTPHQAEWADVFRTLTVLEKITLGGWGCSSVFWLGLEAASRESETTAANTSNHIPPTCPRLRSVVYATDSDLDDVTLEAAVECLEYREIRGAAALEELEMVYNGHGMSDADTEFAGLTGKYVPRLRELVKGRVSLDIGDCYC